MTSYSRARRKRFIQEAEGYLELLHSISGDVLNHGHRHCLANRALDALDRLEPGDCRDGRDDYLRGQALRAQSRHHEAIEFLTRASRRDPDNADLFLSLAWCYKRVGRLDLAIASLEDALEFEPERAILHYNLACYWSLTNNVGLALAHLTRAFELNFGYRQLVAAESDFEPVRNHPEFLALTGLVGKD